METCFNYVDQQKAFFSSDERKWISKIRELAAERPDEVHIICQPETNDGCIYASLPSHYLKLAPKKKLSDEQRAILSERMKRTLWNNEN